VRRRQVPRLPERIVRIREQAERFGAIERVGVCMLLVCVDEDLRRFAGGQALEHHD
jgi:hypothetical protein